MILFICCIGYALSQSTYAIIVRYRVPDPTWEGSPSNAACYDYTNQSQPLSYNQLGNYTPQAFGGSFAAFLSGSIGMVSKDGPWPSALTPMPTPAPSPSPAASGMPRWEVGLIVGCVVGFVCLLILGLLAYACLKLKIFCFGSSSPPQPSVDEERATSVEMGVRASERAAAVAVSPMAATGVSRAVA